MRRPISKEFIISEIKKLQLCLMEFHMGDLEAVDIKQEEVKELLWDLEKAKEKLMTEEENLGNKRILEGLLN
ncbi:MAG: hypothetical protein D5R97_09605, partial [Candidatus Syntrophonatronum acetioxidans]